MEFERLAEEIHEVFAKRSYQWKFDGELKFPVLDDIKATIEKVQEAMIYDPDGSRFEVGRLIFIKTGDNLDVYVLQGTLKYEKDEKE
jgi:hypothetical protein